MRYFDLVDDTVWEWEKRTGMKMDFSFFYEVFQKDVNNYLLIGKNGKTKTKGAYTKALSKVDFDLPIINKALVDFMTKSIPVEKTINECDDLIMFQKIIKLTGKYWAVWHNGEYTFDKCHRVFASKNKNDTYIGKCKKKGATIEKFGNTPDHCFLDNDNVKQKKVPDKLDKQWYIDLSKHRLEQYGIEV
jgi:DNA polymerase